MKNKKLKISFAVTAVLLAVIMLSGLINIGQTAYAEQSADGDYSESYRNQLAFSALEGWNNDPNGLIYVNGVWHMYYQYNYAEDGSTDTVWGNMSWGHATSTDLVHWEEQEVAIPAYRNAENQYGETEWYGMMYSGSTVYDEYNTSGLFKMNADGTVVDGSGIIAILTQPKWSDELQSDIQRQILCYSEDGGYTFKIYGEILGSDDDGGMGDNEFRDPNVFWSEEHQKWIMAVGGGLIRMYSSDNLIDWEYLGSTGFWGECPDLSCYEVDGETKYVLIMSPEDKTQSHYYNGTSRADTYYPAEYYVVGELDEDGLFVAEADLQRLSYGMDTYAFQSFNNSPDGKVYGISWSASWKNVGDFESLRENYNGGMTVACELNLVKDDSGAYMLERTPVEGCEDLRGDVLSEYSGTLRAGANALGDTQADIFELQATLDFTGSSATYAQIELRVSDAEKTALYYDVESSTLTFDRSQSSLLARDINYYCLPSEIPVELEDGKLEVQILCDRAFVSVFVNGQSLFSAIFPSAISNGMKLYADGSIYVTSTVWKLSGIFGDVEAEDELIVTTDKLDITTGERAAVIASSYYSGFNAENLSFAVTQGEDYISIMQSGQTLYVTALGKGYAQITVTYGSVMETIDVYVYNNGFVGDIDYIYSLSGFTMTTEDGVFLSSTGDSFLFSDTYADEFVYTADISVNSGGQACGLVFGVSANYYDYFVATADFSNNVVKIWRAGSGDIASVSYDFASETFCKITVTVNNGAVKVKINDDETAALVCALDDYNGGYLGFNAYNAEATINNVALAHISGATYEDNGNVTLDFSGYTITKIVNITDGSYRLTSSDYSETGGVITINSDYLSTLSESESYSFRIVTEECDFTVTVTTDFTGATATVSASSYTVGDEVTITVSGGNVTDVLIDGTALGSSDYTVEDGVITISAEAVENLADGSHTVTVLTDNGRPQTSFTLKEQTKTTSTETSATYFWLIIDLLIFGAFIVGYIAVTVINKMRKKKEAV